MNVAAKAMTMLASRTALASGVTQLGAAGVPSAALSAELLLLHILGKNRAWLYAHPEYALTAGEETAYAKCLAQRSSGVPTQYLTGHQEFWGLDFIVTPDVLIPRPETEHVIEVALTRLEARAAMRTAGYVYNDDMAVLGGAGDDLAIADVGTGSACLAVALATELPGARVIATDISKCALQVAQRNIQQHGLSGRIHLLQTNLLEGAIDRWAAANQDQSAPGNEHEQKGRDNETRGNDGPLSFDLIVSNPPYVARDQAHTLPIEVRNHEPDQALFGGATGIEIYAPLIAQASRALRTGGILVLELGSGAAERVQAMFASSNSGYPKWNDVRIVNDLAGIPRVISSIRF